MSTSRYTPEGRGRCAPYGALVDAADTLVEGFEAMRYLQRVSDHCVELLNARAAGVMLIDGGRSVSPAVSSRPCLRARSALASRSCPSCAGRAARAPTDPRRTLYQQVV
ncbi:hypothetical protein ACGFXB_38810 [Streptomyces canus]|uniref:hypothetical protein n=1 Tax=Streptomyces canus TaxID=58343 RepID=UPI003722EB21